MYKNKKGSYNVLLTKLLMFLKEPLHAKCTYPRRRTI